MRTVAEQSAKDAGRFKLEAKVAELERSEKRLQKAAQEALVVLAAIRLGDDPARHAPMLWEELCKAHDMLFIALAAIAGEDDDA